jgi:hypothetical protein
MDMLPTKRTPAVSRLLNAPWNERGKFQTDRDLQNDASKFCISQLVKTQKTSQVSKTAFFFSTDVFQEKCRKQTLTVQLKIEIIRFRKRKKTQNRVRQLE